MALYPFILLKRKEYIMNHYIINHETIHLKQQKELFIIFFYILYGLEYICRLFQYKFNFYTAYKNISFEREAYKNEQNLNYTRERKPYNFIKYI